jgi:hypothetical protein
MRKHAKKITKSKVRIIDYPVLIEIEPILGVITTRQRERLYAVVWLNSTLITMFIALLKGEHDSKV